MWFLVACAPKLALATCTDGVRARLLVIAAGLLLALPLVGCGDADPDCGSSHTRKLVTQIAKDNKDNRLLNYALVQFDKKEAGGTADCQTNSNQDKCYWFGSLYGNGEIAPISPSSCQGIIPTVGAAEFCKKMIEPNLKERETAVYSLDAIRMTARDADTKAVSCAAQLSVQIDGGFGGQMEIAYKVENTTDGRLYATVYMQ